ncbi:MAG: helix-turn-helix domain-containing protein [Actinomycetota bacterium]|nr:helix-turn-helix domain-containing protein [Actinomycetota bacterium]
MTPIVLKLKELRTAAGLTQVELAKRAGVRQATISALEGGRARRLDLAVVERLAKVLGLKRATDLLEDRRGK